MLYTELSPALKSSLSRLLLDLRMEVQYERANQLIHAQVHNALWRGDYHLVPSLPNPSSSPYAHLLYSPIYSSLSNNGPGSNPNSPFPKRRYRLNYYRGDGAKLIGALSTTPGMKIVCDDKDDYDAYARQSIAQELLTRLYRQWQLEFIMPQICQTFYERANIFAHTPFIVNQSRYGVYQVPNIIQGEIQVLPPHYLCPVCGAMNDPDTAARMSMSCRQCGAHLDQSNFVPAVTETGPVQDPNNPYLLYPKGSVELTLHDCWTVFTSFSLTRWEDAQWLCCEQEFYRGELLQTFPFLRNESEYRKFMTGGKDDMDNAYDAIYRASSTSYTSNTALSSSNRTRQANKLWWKLTEWYLTPSMLVSIETAPERNTLLTLFPNGCKVTLINNNIAKLSHADLHAEWVGAAPYVARGFYQRPLGEEHAAAARLINDMVEIIVSTAKKGSPITIYHPELLDISKIKDKDITVLEFIRALPAVGQSIREMIYQTSPAQLPPHVRDVFEMFVGGTRENANVNPPMWGAGPPESTLGATSLKRDQSLQPHNVTYFNIRRLLGRTMDNGIKMLARNATALGEVFFSMRPGEQDTYHHPDIKSILKGGFYTHVDNTIPMNPGQINSRIWQMLIDVNPAISMPILGLDRPQNVRALQEAVGFKQLEVSKLNDYNKVMRSIRLLAQSDPVIDPATNLPAPSIPVDEFEDDHLFAAELVKEWLKSDKGHQLRMEDQRNGTARFENVRLWAMKHLEIANMIQTMQANAMMGGAGPQEGMAGAAGSNGQAPDLSNPLSATSPDNAVTVGSDVEIPLPNTPRPPAPPPSTPIGNAAPGAGVEPVSPVRMDRAV